MTVLYEGQQIYFGRTGEAQKFFEDMGFLCPPRQTTADFLTSLTSPSERRVRPGYEDKVPRTPTEFAQRWRNSPECARLTQEIEAFDQEYPIGGESFEKFGEARRLMQSKQQFVIQVPLCQEVFHSDTPLQTSRISLYTLGLPAGDSVPGSRLPTSSRRRQSDHHCVDWQFLHVIDHWQRVLRPSTGH